METCSLSHSINNQVKSRRSNPISLCRWSNCEMYVYLLLFPCGSYVYNMHYLQIQMYIYIYIYIANWILTEPLWAATTPDSGSFKKVWIRIHIPHIMCSLKSYSFNGGNHLEYSRMVQILRIRQNIL